MRERVTVTVAGEDDQREVVELRTRVFVDEQGVPSEIEQDEHDAVAIHAAARDLGGRLVGTGRAVLDGAGSGVAKVGRMAVASDARGQGVGTAVLELLEREAGARGARRILLHAQDHAIDFYLRAGYEPEGEPFVEAGIGHVAMTRTLS